MAEIRRCGICGCTDEQPCSGGCRWVFSDLCSACAKKDVVPIEIPLPVAAMIYEILMGTITIAPPPLQLAARDLGIGTFVNELGRALLDLGVTETQLAEVTEGLGRALAPLDIEPGNEEQPRIILPA